MSSKRFEFLLFVGMVLGSNIVLAFPTLDCRFAKISEVQHEALNVKKAIYIQRTLRVVAGKSFPLPTLENFGRRASGSATWTPLEPVSYSMDTAFVGDQGDILTLNHSEDDSHMPLRGIFRTSLVYTYQNSTYISIGVCRAD